MALAQGHTCLLLLKLLLMYSFLVPVMAEERRECREQEYKDQFGNCILCKQCDAGQELSKECGFGYGEDARCVPCRASRFKEERSLHKCKPCLDCGLINRFQKANCSTTSNAVCGDCLSGFYRKTKLSGFQDMECIPCGDPPPPYEPHCSGRVNLVPIPSTVTSPRDMALAAVICSALATVLLALLILCVIYCKRQLLEKKPSASLRSQDGPYNGAELSCLDRRRVLEFSQRPCCHGHHGPGQTCGPVHLIPSLCCDETCSLGRSGDTSPLQSQSSLNDGHVNPSLGSSQADLGTRPVPLPGEFSEAWPLMRNPACADSLLNRLQCDPELAGRTTTSSEEEEKEEGEEQGSGSSHHEKLSAVQNTEAQHDSRSLLDSSLHPKQQLSSL